MVATTYIRIKLRYVGVMRLWAQLLSRGRFRLTVMTNTLTSKRLQEQELYAFSQHLVWLDFFCD